MYKMSPCLTIATLTTGRQQRPAGPQRTAVSITPDSREAASHSHRYVDLADRPLADRLATEDAAVEAGLSPFERLTCPAHRRWLYRCIASPQHALPTTGHRWCRDCDVPATVAVDELSGDVTVTCPRCGRMPNTIATRQIVRTCRASLATAQGSRDPHIGTAARR